MAISIKVAALVNSGVWFLHDFAPDLLSVYFFWEK